MKKHVQPCLKAAVLAAMLATAGLASAQSATTTVTSTSSEGTVSDFTPDTISVRAEPAAQPISYSFSKTTTYVDENGNPVSMETVRSGMPVTVYYTQDGNRMVASKVVVQRTTSTGDLNTGSSVVTKKTTTTTTSSPSE